MLLMYGQPLGKLLVERLKIVKPACLIIQVAFRQ